MNKERLEVTDQMLDRVVFGMENQKDRLFLDPNSGVLCPDGDGEHLIPLPPWGPTEGFRLMEEFTATLANDASRRRLTDILQSGSGVFRRFKSTVQERPEIEHLWRRYKMRVMRRTALAWLARWSEALSLESLEPEPEDWDDLTLADFDFRPGRDADVPTLRQWDEAALAEFTSHTSPAFNRADVLFRREGVEVSSKDVIVADNSAQEAVGFVWMHLNMQKEGRLLQVYVLPEYRGLGLGRILLEKAFDQARERGARHLCAVMPQNALNGVFKNCGFESVVRVWRRLD